MILGVSYIIHAIIAATAFAATAGALAPLSHYRTLVVVGSFAAVFLLAMVTELRLRRHRGAALTGALLAAFTYSVLYQGFDWALAHPTDVNSATYLPYLVDSLRQPEGVLLFVAAPLLTATVAFAGYAAAKLLKRKQA